jgi:hypothetical protein
MFYRWLEGNDFLVIKKDRHDPLIVMSAKLLARFLALKPLARLIEKAVGQKNLIKVSSLHKNSSHARQ